MLPNVHDLRIGLYGICRVAVLQRLTVCVIDVYRTIRHLEAQINTRKRLAAKLTYVMHE
jgi:hypothetical protein